MNEDENDDFILLEQHVLDAEDFVEAEVEPVDDYEPAEEVILLDTLRLEDDDLLDFA
ncbi:MAG TPA: hypothetical protein VMZ53_27165 [Kofleriaceae bacterium]|nr:hypothetical protein [Kofleriaceae bacterium]